MDADNQTASAAVSVNTPIDYNAIKIYYNNFMNSYHQAISEIPALVEKDVQRISCPFIADNNRHDKLRKSRTTQRRKEIDDKYNSVFNDYLIKTFSIHTSDYTNDQYVEFYDRNRIILIPTYVHPNKEGRPEYLCYYTGMTETNWSIINKPINKTNYQPNSLNYSNYKIDETPDNDNDIDEDEDTTNKYAGKPTKKYYDYRHVQNSIEAYTGKQSNLMTVDFDYAFKSFSTWYNCFVTSQLATLTKNGFHFHYTYSDKLRTSKVGKDTNGVDIKNNTAVRMPPSYYEIDNEFSIDGKFTYRFFIFNDPRPMPEQLIEELNNLFNPNGYIPIEEMKPEKLNNIAFMKLIDMLPDSKSDNVQSWKEFGRICALLNYSVEYFDYFSKKSGKYDYEENLKYYNEVYKKVHEERLIIKKLEDNTPVTDRERKTAEEFEISLKCCKPTLINWIKEVDIDFFNLFNRGIE